MHHQVSNIPDGKPNETQADGQPRHGTAARACCPAGAMNVPTALDRHIDEARRKADDYLKAGFDVMAAFQRGRAAALVELQLGVYGKLEEPPAGNHQAVTPPTVSPAWERTPTAVVHERLGSQEKAL